MDWNLFEGGKTRASALQWDYRLGRLEDRRTDLLQKIDLQVEDALKRLQVATANIGTSRTALRQAKALLDQLKAELEEARLLLPPTWTEASSKSSRKP